MKKVLLAFCVLCNIMNTKAQLFGTLHVPSNYTSVASVIADLNLQGTFGNVTVAIAAGYTETAPLGGYSLTASGTATSTITFEKFGAGPNPLITAYSGGSGTPGSLNQDGVWKLIGSDYITIDGIDIIDLNTTNPQTMEFGYGLYKLNGIDGCQYNTIKNCVITLNRVNNATGSGPAVDGSRGINMVNSTPNANTTALTIFSADGSNSYNQFYSNTIQNCNIGIAMIGFADVSPFNFADKGNDVGGTSAATGNTIINFGGGGNANPAAGIRTLAQYDLNIAYNILNNNTGSGISHPAVIRGIYLNTATSANASVRNNTLTISGGGTTSQVSVIENVSGSTAASNTITITDNRIVNCNYSTATTGPFYGIYSTATPAYLNINNNTFQNNSTNASSGTTYLIYNTGGIGVLGNINNNKLSFTYNGPAAYTGAMYNIYNTGTSLTSTLNINNNSFSNYNHVNVNGSGSLYFIYNTGDVASLSLSSNNWTGLSMNHSALEYFMYNTSSTQSILTVCNNTVTNHTRNAASGAMYFYYCAATTPGTAVHTFSNNLVSNINCPVSGTGAFYGIYNTEGNTSPYPRKLIYGNKFSNINVNTTGTFYGMNVTDLGDGGTGAGSEVYNNSFENITTSGTLYGLYSATPTSPLFAAQIYSNTINGLTSNGGASVVYGADIGSSNAGVNFYKNKISNITANGGTGTAHGLYGIATTTTTFHNNIIGNIYTPAATGAARVNGIYINAGSNYNILYNTVHIDGTSTGAAFNSNAIYAVTASTINLRNNIFVNNSIPTGAGIAAAYRRSSTTLTSYSATSNNNLFYAGTPGANNVIHHNGTNAYQTLATFQTAMGTKDAASVTQNPSFVSLVGSSPNFLHITPNIASLAESGAVNIGGITDDHENNTRQGNAGYAGTGTAPDIGADEFDQNLNPCASANAGAVSASSSTICSAQTVTLISNGFTPGVGITHQWKVASISGGPYSNVTGGSGATSIEYATAALTNGTYYFVLETTCANGPVSALSAETAIVVNAIPTASASVTSSLICTGQSINLLASTNIGTSYYWTGPGYNSTLQNPVLSNAPASASGVYNLQTTANNCTSPVSSVTVEVSEASLSLLSTAASLCLGDASTLTVNSAASTYSWSTGAVTNSIVVSPTVTTVYSVVVTNTANCNASESITISAVNPTITALGKIACGPSVTATLSVNAFTPSTVNWYANPTTTTSLFTGSSFTVNAPTTTTYYAEAHSAGSGSLFTTVAGSSAFMGEMFDLVAINSLIVTGFDVQFGTIGTSTVEIWYRPGTHVGFTASNAGWTLASTVVMATGGPGVATPVPAVLSVPIPAGQTYAFYIVATAGPLVRYSGGTALGSVFGQNADLQVLEGSTGNTYFNANTSPRGFNGTIHYVKPGCLSPRVPVTLTVSPIPALAVTANPATVCPGNPATLSANGANTYSWTGMGAGTSIVASPTVNSTYTVTGTDVFGCAGTETVVVDTYSLPVITALQTVTSICPSGVTSFTAFGASTYTWSTGTIGPVTTVTPATNAQYTVTGTSPEGCISGDTLAIITRSVPVISISQSTTTVCAGEAVTFTATGASTYTWLPGNLSATMFTVNPVANSVYNAIGTSVNGCTNIAFATVVADPCTGIKENFFANNPVNVFPNPSNGIFSVVFDFAGSKKLRITNTLGTLVYESETVSTSEKIDLEHLSKGIYFIEVCSGKNQTSFKLIIE